MKTGKVPVEILEKEVFARLKVERPEVLVKPKIGEDCSVLDFGEYVCVLSTDPITGAITDVGRLAVHVSCNDIASNGVEPLGILLTILAPEGTSAEELGQIMEQVNCEAAKINVAVLGGHTEITSAVQKVIISATAIGRARKGNYVTSSGARPGNDLVVTKAVGLEGTAILAADFAHRLQGKVEESVLSKARQYVEEISVVPEGILAAKNGATAMHDITEGGLLGAVYEMAQSSGVGVRVEEGLIPLKEETKAICTALGVNPYLLISSGALLIAAEDGARLVKVLQEAEISAAVIGKVTEKEKIFVTADGIEIPIVPPKRDELYRIIEELE